MNYAIHATIERGLCMLCTRGISERRGTFFRGQYLQEGCTWHNESDRTWRIAGRAKERVNGVIVNRMACNRPIKGQGWGIETHTCMQVQGMLVTVRKCGFRVCMRAHAYSGG